MKITFVAFGYENLGVEYLSSYLKQNGHQTSLVFDPALFKTFHVENNSLANIFNYKKRVLRQILETRAEIIAFSVLSDNYYWAKEIAQEIKLLKKDAIIVFGGIHPSSVPELVIKENFVDYVCVGESEEAFTELLDAIESKKNTRSIKNIWSKEGDTIYPNEARELIKDLDILPLPDKDLFYSEYKGFTNNIYMTMTSRGCPYRCTYCYNNYLMEMYVQKGPYLRRFSVKRVIDELSLAKEKYHMKRIVFVDDVFTSNASWLKDFVCEYKAKINLPFGCLVHPNFVNEQIVTLLKEAGCTSVGMGIQTLNEDLKRDILRREESNITVERAIDIIKKANIFIYVDFIFGLLNETEDDVLKEAYFLSKMRPDCVSTLWLRYYPKTEIIKIAKANKMLSDEEEQEINQALTSNPVSSFGNSKTVVDKKLISFLLLSANLPLPIVEKMIKYKLFRLLPKSNLHHMHTLIKRAYNKIFLKKDGILYSSMSGLIKFYLTYLFRFMFNKKRGKIL